MNREERIAEARRMAAERAPSQEAEAQQRARRIAQRLANVGASQAQRHVTAAEQTGNAVYLGPVKTPREWERAVELARLVTITRAKRHDTITYAELKWAILDELRMLVDPAALEELLLAIGRESDGVPLAAIIVHPDSGEPSDDFLLATMEMGFDLPLAKLQRQVYEHFG
jgi:hypothetical protein